MTIKRSGRIAHRQLPQEDPDGDSNDEALTEALQDEMSRTEDAESPSSEAPIVNSEEFDNGRVGDEREGDEETTRNQASGNLLFFVGSVLYLWLALWDLTSWYIGRDDENYDGSWDSTWDVISIMAPSSFVLNALVDFRHALFDGEDDYRLRIATNTSFGLAAVLELIPSVLYLVKGDDTSDNQKWQTLTYRAAMLMYLVNAFLAISQNWKRREEVHSEHYPMIHTGQDNLVQCGDWLFLVGSMIDVSISYIPADRETTRFWHSVEVWGVLSATLWLVDATLYIMSDWMEMRSRAIAHVVVHHGEVVDGDDCPDTRHSSPNQRHQQVLLEQLI